MQQLSKKRPLFHWKGIDNFIAEKLAAEKAAAKKPKQNV